MRIDSFRHRGFTLVEMAVVLVILGLVLSTLLLPIQAQREIGFQRQTETQLDLAKKALMGFAQSQGRLPCPATAGSSGIEARLADGVTCEVFNGFLPAATLGIQPTDSNGFAIDGWNNRIGYTVTPSSQGGAATADFTTAGDMNTVGIASLTPDLRVCLSATGISSTTCSATTPENNYLINNAVAVIYSTGATANLGSGGLDEAANLDGDRVFVSHDIRANDPNGEFDHIVVWISPYILYNAMIQAGQLH
ncbi:MAG: prepilin-type N-terminal cleavage/methylation domain-containing protein [Methylophilaceae bacterium]